MRNLVLLFNGVLLPGLCFAICLEWRFWLLFFAAGVCSGIVLCAVADRGGRSANRSREAR